MVSQELKQKAFSLRDAGHSYKYIERELNIRRSTLSDWFRGRPFSPNLFTLTKIKNGPIISAQNRIKARIERTQSVWSKASEELGKLSDRDMLMLGLGLYMGEGTKSGGVLRFSNADPKLINFFMKWLRQNFRLEDKNFAIRVHSYPDIDSRLVEKYWLEITNLPPSCLRSTIVDTRQKLVKKAGKLPYGTAHVTILAAGEPRKGTELFRYIEGCIKAVHNNIEHAGIV